MLFFLLNLFYETWHPRRYQLTPILSFEHGSGVPFVVHGSVPTGYQNHLLTDVVTGKKITTNTRNDVNKNKHTQQW